MWILFLYIIKLHLFLYSINFKIIFSLYNLRLDNKITSCMDGSQWNTVNRIFAERVNCRSFLLWSNTSHSVTLYIISYPFYDNNYYGNWFNHITCLNNWFVTGIKFVIRHSVGQFLIVFRYIFILMRLFFIQCLLSNLISFNIQKITHPSECVVNISL
jgi:hypothetical protein